MILYSRKPLFDIVLTFATRCIILGGTLGRKGQEKEGKKKGGQSMEKSVQNMLYYDESLQIPGEQMAFEQ